jgi:hypothetical protein
LAYARIVDAQALLASDVLTAQRWLDNAEANPTSIPSDFNWHGLAEGAATNARVTSAIDDADAWASVSLRVYARLAANAERSASFELSAMNLRSWMIARYGRSERDPARDLRKLVDWFQQNIPMPIAEVEIQVGQLRALPMAQWSERLELVRTLRALKNRLNVFRNLDDVPDEIRPWLKLWPLLP